MHQELFDDLTEIYDALIDWPKRLALETPFYRQLFEAHEARRILDAACGTGRHAAMFHSWSLEVEATDISPAMIQRARDHFGDPDGLTWSVRGFDQKVPSAGSFGAAVCVGNSLALAPDMATVERAIAQLLHAIRRGGAAVVHVLNLWRLEDGPCGWQKCKRAKLPQGDVLIHKGIHRCGASGYVNLLVSTLDDPPALRTESVRFLGLEMDDLAGCAERAGTTSVQFFGGYQGQPYDRKESVDLIMVAER